MRLDLSDDQQFFRETVNRFITTELPMTTVRELISSSDGFDRSWWKQGAELGWTSFMVPEELGGGTVSGDGAVDLAIVAEEMGRGVTPGVLLPVNVVAETIGRSGSDDQKAFLAGVLSGETVLAWCFKESAGDWDGRTVELRAERSNGDFILTGVKTAVEAGAQADQLLVTTRCDGGLTQFLVPADTPGIEVIPQSSLDLARRFAEVRFDGVKIGAEMVVGGVGLAEADVERQRQLAMMLQCAEMAGAMARVFEFTVEYAFDRHSFGRPLASYQALKHRFADMKLWLEASHAVSDAAALAVARDEDAATRVSAAKVYIGDRAIDLIQDCVQLHGGIGVTWEHDIHMFLRRVTVNRGLFGNPDFHRESLAVAVGL